MWFCVANVETGFVKRIINEEGKIEFFRIYKISNLPDINEILTFLRNLDEKDIIQP